MKRFYFLGKNRYILILFFSIPLISCKAQDNYKDIMSSHIKIVKDKTILLPKPLSKDLFCKSLSAIKIPNSLYFKDENNDKIDYFFLQLYFTVDSIGNVSFPQDKNNQNRNFNKEILENLKKSIQESKWQPITSNKLAVFDCKIYASGIKDIYINSEDNFRRDSYCK